MINIQRASTQILEAVIGAGRNLNQAIDSSLQQYKVTPSERGAIRDISFGSLRYLGELDAILNALSKKPIRDIPVRCLLIASLYQLRYTRASAHAVVDQAVKTVHTIGFTSAKNMVNAILRNFLRNTESLSSDILSNEVARYSYPQWWIDKLKQQYPAQYQAIMDTTKQRPPMILRANIRKNSTNEYLQKLLEAELSARTLPNGAIILEQATDVSVLPGFTDGRVSVQDTAAQYAAPLLDVKNGMRVLDACAAPGGKTAHILELAVAKVTALDIDEARLKLVEQNLYRLGLKATLLCADAANRNVWQNGEVFDRILADVPCSASGVTRRHPDIKWLRRASDIPAFAERQGEILEALWQILATHGKLLYSTCSIFHEENEIQIAQFLKHHKDAVRLPLTIPGLDHNGQLLPNAEQDGFFFALLQKL